MNILKNNTKTIHIALNEKKNDIKDSLGKHGINNKLVRTDAQSFIKETFNVNEPEISVKNIQNSIVSDYLDGLSLRLEKERIEELYNRNNKVIDIHKITDSIYLVEIYDDYNKCNYYQPIINNKIINHMHDDMEKAIILALSYKYNVEEFAYQAITTLLGIKDEE